jgi:hypothetical protein
MERINWARRAELRNEPKPELEGGRLKYIGDRGSMLSAHDPDLLRTPKIGRLLRLAAQKNRKGK